MSKRRKVAHEPLTPTRNLPKRYHVCQICSASIPTADIAAHYVHERNQLSACQPSIKRPAAVEALAKIVNRPRSKRTEAELLLNRVRANREARRKSEIVDLEDDQNIQECPLCGLRLIGIGMSASEHMQSCIDLQGELEREREEETWDRYEVGGQIRVRAIGLLEGGIRSIPNAVVHSDDDGPDCIVDVEGDTEAVYGGIQYTEEDLNDPGARPSGKTTDLRCNICLNPYSTPVISVQCFHTYCEKCWLQTLQSQKLCPQCRIITQPSDLRRIYL